MRHRGIGKRKRAQRQIVGVKIFRALAFNPLDLRLSNARFDRSDHAHGDLVLERENVCQIAIVSRPKMRTGLSLDQLAGDANAAACLADAALKHVAHAKLAPHLLHVHHFTLICET